MGKCKNERRFIIFGAGAVGQELLAHLQNEVAFFCDNDKDKVGTYIESIQVISFQDYLKISCQYNIIVAISDYRSVKAQLEANGIYDYILYESDNSKKGWRIVGNSPIKKKNKHNDKMNYYIDESKIINPIKNFTGFRKLVKQCKKSFPANELILFEMHNSESAHYGYGRALMDYAGIEVDYDRFPLVFHGAGIRYPKAVFSPYNFSTATIVSTEVFRRYHNDRVPWVPIFTVGPYIRYAASLYSQKEVQDIKERNGKTVLIFISHSIETGTVRYDWKRVFGHIIKKYASAYKKVFVCAYWHDIDKRLYDELDSAGVDVVSAGFRWDPLFVRRQRTLFDLCDKVVFYGYSTALPFALTLQKPTIFHDLDLDYDEEESTEKRLGVGRVYGDDDNYLSIVKNYLQNPDDLTEEERELLCKNFGMNIKRTKDEIQSFYKISCDIWRNCDYQVRYYPMGVYRTYWQYQDEYDFEKINILTKSLGTGFLS